MLDWSHLPVFLLASLALVLVPGPNVIYILTRGIGQGRQAAVASALGVTTGTLVHIALTAAGLAALLAASATAFTLLKYAGAAYLIYLGVRTMLAPGQIQLPGANVAASPVRRMYGQGVMINVLNPKVALFFLAFLPQFTDPARGSVAVQIVILGLLFMLLGLATDLMYALGSGAVGAWLARRPAFLRNQRYFTGVMYCALGAVTALSGGDQRR